jgi:hypothetical protein
LDAKETRPNSVSQALPPTAALLDGLGFAVPDFSSGKRKKPTMYDSAVTVEFNSYALALCSLPGLGPNGKVARTELSANGIQVKWFICRQADDCEFRARIYFPGRDISDPLSLEYCGPVAAQVAFRHTCGKIVSWSTHLSQKREDGSKKGLHPLLKDAVRDTGGSNIHCLPKPDEMLNRIIERLGDECEQLFPTNSIAVVSNQIREFWKQARREMTRRLAAIDRPVNYLPDIAAFRVFHGLRLPANYVVPSLEALMSMESTESIRRYSSDLFQKGGTKYLRNPHLGPKITSEENEMFCLTVPPVDDSYVGPLIQKALDLDYDGTASKHLVCFSTVKLLFQGFLVMAKFAGNMMACIDSSHGGDSGGGKLQSFGLVSNTWHGRGSEYRRSYIPLIFARILNENEAGAVLMLGTLLFWVRRLFGLVLDISGGLISDHANSFVNAYEKVFPGRKKGQCYPHINLKMNDKPGRRKRGTAGYYKYALKRAYLKITCTDVHRFGHSPTKAFKDAYTQLSLQAWKDDGEAKLATTFSGSYVTSEAHSHFMYCEFGNPGETPQSNSIERFHLKAKGSKQFQGYCFFGQSVDQMLKVEFPRLVHLISSRTNNVDRVYRVLDKAAVMADNELLKEVSRLSESDFMRIPNANQVVVNDMDFVGYAINVDRLRVWQRALGGDFVSADKGKQRHRFWHQATSLKVLRKTILDKKELWVCSCPKFWNTTACPHSFYMHYGAMPNVSVQQDKSKRQGLLPREYLYE